MPRFSVDIAADVKKYQREFARIPGMTDAAAAKAALALEKRLNKAQENAARAAQREARKAGSAWQTAMGTAMGMLSAGALKQAATSFVMLSKEVVDYRNELTDAAARTGLMNEQLQALRMSAEASGQEFGPFLSSMERLPKLLANVDAGSVRAVKAFDNLGIKVHKADGTLRQSADVVEDIVKALGSIEDPSERAIRGMDLFGRAGGKVVQALAAGAESFEEMNKFARQWGVETGPEAKKVAGDIQVQLSAMQMTIRGLKDDFVTTALGGVKSMRTLAQSIAFVGRFGIELLNSQIEDLTSSWEALTNVFAGTTLREGADNLIDAGKALVGLTAGRPFEIIGDTAGALGAASVAAEEMGEAMDALMASLEDISHEGPGTFEGFGGGVDNDKDKVVDLTKELEKLAAITAKADSDQLSDLDKLDEAYNATLIKIQGIAIAIDDWKAAGEAMAAADARYQRDRDALLDAEIAAVVKQQAAIDEAHRASLEKRAEMERQHAHARLTLAGAVASGVIEIAGMVNAEDQKAAMRAWRITRGASLAQVGINTFVAASEAAASAPPPINIPLIAAALLQGGVMAMKAASVPPPNFYPGTANTGRGSPWGMPSTLHPEEAVANKTGAEILGRDNIAAANRGEDIRGVTVLETFVDGRQQSTSVARQVKRGGALANLWRRKTGKVGHWSATDG